MPFLDTIETYTVACIDHCVRRIIIHHENTVEIDVIYKRKTKIKKQIKLPVA
jgi:hypothetical protein